MLAIGSPAEFDVLVVLFRGVLKFSRPRKFAWGNTEPYHALHGIGILLP